MSVNIFWVGFLVYFRCCILCKFCEFKYKEVPPPPHLLVIIKKKLRVFHFNSLKLFKTI